MWGKEHLKVGGKYMEFHLHRAKIERGLHIEVIHNFLT